MSRRSKEQRRADYLDIGAELVAESAGAGVSQPGFALSHVKVVDVAERAGVTKGAMYHLWPSQEAFWQDLLVHLMETNRHFGTDRLAAMDADLAQAIGSVPTLRGFANAVFDSLSNDPTFFARVSLLSYLDDEWVRGELDRSFRSKLARGMAALEGSLTAIGRRIIPGATAWDLAVAVAALLDGLCLQHRISPERTPELQLDGDERWTLFASAAEALMLGYTEPIGTQSVGGGC